MFGASSSNNGYEIPCNANVQSTSSVLLIFEVLPDEHESESFWKSVLTLWHGWPLKKRTMLQPPGSLTLKGNTRHLKATAGKGRR